MGERRIEQWPLKRLQANPRNPKAHDIDTIEQSVRRFGVIDIIAVDERTGFTVSGHGRAKTLTVKRDKGEDPPDGVTLAPDGDWLVPVVLGWESADDIEAAAALIALNRTTELGGWVDTELLGLLDELSGIDGGTDGVGFTDDDIEALRRRLAMVDLPEPEQDPDKYTRKVDVPHYEVRGDNPPVSALTDTTRTDELLDRINAAEVPPDVRTFLRAAAFRHTVFNYAAIAEFYAHADPTTQRLMEESALVIIDFDDAIRLGYVALTEAMEEVRSEDLITRGVKIGVLDEETGDPLDPDDEDG